MDQALVEQARKDIEAKDESIFKLTKEVVELRLLRDEVDSPAKTTQSSDESPPCRVSCRFLLVFYYCVINNFFVKKVRIAPLGCCSRRE